MKRNATVVFALAFVIATTCVIAQTPEQKENVRYKYTAPTNSRSESVEKEVTEAQALEFAHDLEQSIQKYNIKRANKLVDMFFIYELAFREVDYPEQVEKLYLEAASNQSMMTSVISQVRNMGSYHFLRLKSEGDACHPVFRLVTQNGEHAYHEFKLALNSKGQSVASDFLSTAVGKWTQEDLISNMMSQLHARGESIEISDTGKLFIAHAATFKKMLRAVNFNEDLKESLEEFRKIPEELQADRRYLIMATSIASRISQEDFEIEVERFNKYISDKSFADQFLLEPMIRQKKTEDALEIIQRMDVMIGGDIFLDLLRARAFLASDRLEEAREAIERVRVALPDVYAIYTTSAVIAARRREFQKVTELFREIANKFGQPIDIDRIFLDEGLTEYVESLEFQEFRKSIPSELSK